MSEKLVWRIFWSILLLCVVSSVGLTCIAYKYASGKESAILEAIKMFLLCLGGIGVVLSLYFSAVSIYLSRKEMISQRQFSIIENTFELLSRWDDPHFLEARKWTRDLKLRKLEISDQDMIKEINGNQDLNQSVLLILNYLEHVRFSIITERVDKEKFYNSLGVTLINIAKRFSAYAESVNAQAAEDLYQLISILQKSKKE